MVHENQRLVSLLRKKYVGNVGHKNGQYQRAYVCPGVVSSGAAAVLYCTSSSAIELALCLVFHCIGRSVWRALIGEECWRPLLGMSVGGPYCGEDCWEPFWREVGALLGRSVGDPYWGGVWEVLIGKECGGPLIGRSVGGH